eukprot:870074_1
MANLKFIPLTQNTNRCNHILPLWFGYCALCPLIDIIFFKLITIIYTAYQSVSIAILLLLFFNRCEFVFRPVCLLFLKLTTILSTNKTADLTLSNYFKIL